MSERELSFQQRDPVGSYGVRPVTLLVSVGVILLSVMATITSWPVETNPVVAFLAVAVTVASAFFLSFWSNPLRAPFRTASVFVVLFLSMSAVILSPIATWGSSALVVHQWAPMAAGLTVAQLAPYRPARELVGVTILGGITTAFVAILHASFEASGVPPLVLVLNATVPLLALGFGGTAFAATLMRSHASWYSRSISHARAVSPAVREGVVRSVRHDRVSILNDTVVPFFNDLLYREEVTPEDRQRARAIAANIRSVMVADVDRSWLDAVMDQLADERADALVPGSEAIQDHDRLAVGMSTEQRIVMRAVIIALFDHPGFDSDGFGILIAYRAPAAAVTLSAKLDADDSVSRSGLAPYLAVLRIAFNDLQVSFQAPTLTLKFSYDHK